MSSRLDICTPPLNDDASSEEELECDDSEDEMNIEESDEDMSSDGE